MNTGQPSSFEPIPTNTPEFGQCAENPSGNEHRFTDLGARFGAQRWRCEFCFRSQLELREAAASLN